MNRITVLRLAGKKCALWQCFLILLVTAVMGCGTSAPDIITSSGPQSGFAGNCVCPGTES